MQGRQDSVGIEFKHHVFEITDTGQVQLAGTPAELRERVDVAKAYLGIIH